MPKIAPVGQVGFTFDHSAAAGGSDRGSGTETACSVMGSGIAAGGATGVSGRGATATGSGCVGTKLVSTRASGVRPLPTTTRGATIAAAGTTGLTPAHPPRRQR